MTKTLRIEVTDELAMAAHAAYFDDSGPSDIELAVMQAALTAAFQHPEFVAQFMACVPANAKRVDDDAYVIEAGAITLTVNTAYATGYNCANDITRASLGRLLGEDGK